jgi:hypothetical protein
VPNSITGKVQLFNSDSKALLADHSGVNVTLRGTAFSATSSANGEYALTGVPPGVYVLSFAKAGFDSANLSIEYSGVGVEFADPVTLRSKKSPVEIKRVIGVAKLVERHFPDSTYDHKGISVTVQGSAVFAETNSYGEYTLENPPEGQFRMLFNKPGFEEVELVVEPRTDDLHTVETVSLASRSFVTLDRLYHASGNGLIGAWFADSVNEGRVFFNGVAVTSHHDLVVLEGTSANVGDNAASLELMDGDPKTYDFELSPITTIQKNGQFVQLHYRNTLLGYFEASYQGKSVTGRIKSTVFGRKIYSNVVDVPR